MDKTAKTITDKFLKMFHEYYHEYYRKMKPFVLFTTYKCEGSHGSYQKYEKWLLCSIRQYSGIFHKACSRIYRVSNTIYHK